MSKSLHDKKESNYFFGDLYTTLMFKSDLDESYVVDMMQDDCVEGSVIFEFPDGRKIKARFHDILELNIDRLY